jgi:hypothetical protein
MTETIRSLEVVRRDIKQLERWVYSFELSDYGVTIELLLNQKRAHGNIPPIRQ